jgi:hypothetical protein
LRVRHGRTVADVVLVGRAVEERAQLFGAAKLGLAGRPLGLWGLRRGRCLRFLLLA